MAWCVCGVICAGRIVRMSRARCVVRRSVDWCASRSSSLGCSKKQFLGEMLAAGGFVGKLPGSCGQNPTTTTENHQEVRDGPGTVFGNPPLSSQPKPAHSKRQPRPATAPPRGVRLPRAGTGAARLARLEVRTTAQQPQRDEQRGEGEGQRREPGVEVWQRGDRRRLPAQVVGRLGRGLRRGRRRAGRRAGRRAARSVPLGGGARRRR